MSFSQAATTGDVIQRKRDRVIDGRPARYETVITPLSDDGERVDRLMIGMIYDDERR